MTDAMTRPRRQRPAEGPLPTPDHDNFGLPQSKLMLEISNISDVSMNVVDPNMIEWNAGGKPPASFLHLALAKRGPIRAGTMMRGILLALGLTGLASLSPDVSAAARDDTSWSKSSLIRPPMPPIRPSNLAAPPLPVPPPANEPPPGVDPMVADFAADLPQSLPAASRAQMHECGREWQKMKASGAAAEKTWLSFASICLAR